MPEGLWTKCPSCAEMLFNKDLEENLKVCPKCGHHLICTVDERVRFTLDEGSFTELYTDLTPVDRLDFKDKTTYAEKLDKTAKKLGRREAMTIGTGRLHGRDVVFGTMNFQFLGGSMGVVVGEKVTLAVELAMENKQPLILVCASGGARMHEGALSLMQMAKTCAALARFGDEGGLYLAVLTNPTTGGVTASFATMADVILAEPEALIGFAGPRVIQNTIKQELPEGFQRSEFLLQRGQVDRIVRREVLKDELFQLIESLKPRNHRKAVPIADLIQQARPDAAADGSASKDRNGAAKKTGRRKKRTPKEAAGTEAGDNPENRLPADPAAEASASSTAGEQASESADRAERKTDRVKKRKK